MGCDIHWFIEVQQDDGHWKSVPLGINDDLGRNYRLFARLADVRNYDGEEPIAEPRGLPADVSDEVKKDSWEYGMDGHSHSWLSLEELLAAFDQPREGDFCGVVDAEGFRQWKEKGEPANYCREVGGQLVSVCTHGQMESRIRLGGWHLNNAYTVVTWRKKVEFPYFTDILKRMVELGPVEKVRAVFFFDN